MSRNSKYKAKPTSTKKPIKKHRSYMHDVFLDDDDYGGVDLVSDSEEDEADVDEVEEQVIIESEQSDDDLQITTRPTKDEDELSWNGFEDSSFHDLEPIYEAEASPVGNPPWRTADQSSDDDQANSKRVRWDLSDSETDEETFGFPDIFVPQSALATSFRRQIEEDDDQGSDDEFWSHHKPQPPKKGTHSDSSSDSDAESDCSTDSYDSGETTEDEDNLPLDAKVLRDEALRRASESTAATTDSEEEIERSTTPVTVRRGPVLGYWKSEPGIPFVVLDSKRKILTVFGRQARRRSQVKHSSPQGLPMQSSFEGSFMGNTYVDSANLMLSAYNPGNVLNGPEAFFPWSDINGDNSQDEPSSYGEDDDDDRDDETLWRIEDLLDLESDNESQGVPEETGNDADVEDVAVTPRPTTAASEDQTTPRLLDPAIVGAFRSNQHRHRIMSRNNATENSLIFSSSINHTALRGIKEGRISAATVSIAPQTPRGRRATAGSSAATLMPDLSSPAALQGSKRKASGEAITGGGGHKRSRSDY